MSRLDDERAEAGSMRTSTRDLTELRPRLAAWLGGRLGAEAGVSELSHPTANGLSSETLLFDATWKDDLGEHDVACAARLAPAAEAVPVFPTYDLGMQFEVMRLARERAGVPAPRPLWFEPDHGHLGTPFFVMEREDGEVPPDLPPYTFGGWLMDASPAEREGLQRRTVEILARLHEAPVTAGEVAFLRSGHPGDCGLRRHRNELRAYYDWAHGALPIPVLEQAFEWLEPHWPANLGPDVVSWGDARIGNIVYRDFTPAAVLDWEMAGLAPREVDLGWMIFLHQFFQEVTVPLGLPGLPGFMRREDVCSHYADLTGYEPRDMEFYEMYAALRHGVIMARVWQRRIHFGEQPMPDDPDDLVLHRAAIERILDG